MSIPIRAACISSCNTVFAKQSLSLNASLSIDNLTSTKLPSFLTRTEPNAFVMSVTSILDTPFLIAALTILFRIEYLMLSIDLMYEIASSMSI